jgi:hypothetical protein
LSKLTVEQRVQLKEWIKLCRIRGLSLQDTLEFVNKELPEGSRLSMRGLKEYVSLVKRESRQWMNAMALDIFEFISELKDRWDGMKELNRRSWEMLDSAKSKGDIDAEVKAGMLLFKVNDQILQMLMLLPTVRTPSSLEQQQQPQERHDIGKL